MRSLRRVMSSVLIGGALIATVLLGEAAVEMPEVYADGFCLLEQGSRNCSFQTLAQCVEKMFGVESDCVRETLKDRVAGQKTSTKP